MAEYKNRPPKKPHPKKPQPMQPVTIRLPDDLIAALNQATIDDGRPSASDMARVILRRYLSGRGFYSKSKKNAINTTE